MYGAPLVAIRRHPPHPLVSAKNKRSSTMRPMRPFNFNTAAELFPAAIRKKKRAGFAYRRFGTAAEAVRFAMEELPADLLNGAYLQVEEARFRPERHPYALTKARRSLPRRPRPAPVADTDAANAA